MKEKLIELFFDYEKKYKSLVVSKEGLAEHLLANGVIVLPCKVGDTVWQTDGVRLYQSTIKQILLTPKSVFFETGNIVFVEDAICDKRIFLTREEAEAKLESIRE